MRVPTRLNSGDLVLSPDGWGYVGNPKGTREHAVVQLIRRDGWEVKGFDETELVLIVDALRDIASNVDDGRGERAYQALHDLADRIERDR